MKNSCARLIVLFSSFSAGLAWGQGTSAEATLEPPPQTNTLNRIGFSFRMGFNISVDFKNAGGFAAPGHVVPGQGLQPANPGSPTGGGQNRTYEDGYNWVDESGNAFGLTSYWGYDHASQYDPNAGTITMHSSSAPAEGASKNRDDDPLLGFEVTYNREFVRKERWRGGLEAAFGWTDLSLRDRRPFSGDVTLISDTFQLPPTPGGGIVIPPPAPYSGPHDLPPEGAPLLGDSPSRTTTVIAGGASVEGRRRFDADLYGFRVGGYVDIPWGERVLLSFNGGLALAQVESDFKFNELVTVTGTVPANNVGSGSHDDLLAGFYVGGVVSYALNEKWKLFGGAQFQDVGKYAHREGGKKAVLDLTEAIFASFGASYSF